jgi:hypothetical protein
MNRQKQQKQEKKPKVSKASKVSRLGDQSDTDSYQKPEKTATDLLSPDEIKKRISNYEQVHGEALAEIVPNTRVQYFEVLEDKSFKYKPGGIVIVNKYPDYMVLSNGRRNWSVQLINHIIFKEIDIDSLKSNYDTIIAEKDRQIEQLKHLIIKKKKEIEQLKAMI